MPRLTCQLSLLAIIICPVLSGCASPQLSAFRRVESDMDKMQRLEAEFGTMSISSPLLTKPGKNFEFHPGIKANTLFTDAQNIQGQEAELQQSSSSFGLGVQATFNPAAAVGYAAQLQQFQQAVSQNNDAARISKVRQRLQNNAAEHVYLATVNAINKNQSLSQTEKAQQIANAADTYAAKLQAPATSVLPPYPGAANAADTGATPTSSATGSGGSGTSSGAATQAPGSGAPALVKPPTDLLKQFSNKGAFLPLGGLFGASPASLKLSDRDAIMQAAGDNTVLGIFKYLGNPNIANAFRDRIVLFGICTVSVNPGWRTKRNYQANVAMTTSTALFPARASIFRAFIANPDISFALRKRVANDNNFPPPRLPYSKRCASHFNSNMAIPKQYRGTGQVAPIVAAISPFTNAQNLDLSSGFRNESQVALNIAASLAFYGQQASAQTFFKYAKSLQQDVSTVSPNVLVSSFSDGPTFGFQVGPRLKAIQQAKESGYSGPADVLDRESFPTLVAFGFTRSDLHPVIIIDSHGKYRLDERKLLLYSTNTWVPTRAPRVTNWRPLKSIPILNLLSEHYLFTEKKLMHLARRCRIDDSKLRCLLKRSPASDGGVLGGTATLLKYRLAMLRDQVFGGGTVVSFPLQALVNGPRILRVLVDSAAAKSKTDHIILIGKHEREIDLTTAKIIGSSNVPSDVVYSDSVISLAVPPSPTPFFIRFRSRTGGELFSPQIKLPVASDGKTKQPVAIPQASIIWPSSIALKRGADGKVTARTIRVRVAGINMRAPNATKGIDIVQGNAKLGPNFKPTFKDGLLQFDVTIRGAAAPIVFELHFGSGKGAQAINTLPISVEVPTAKSGRPAPLPVAVQLTGQK